MASKGQLTGMRGVYLAASELSRLGLIASLTSRSAKGADILVTDKNCKNTFSIQVKTNASTFTFWLLSKDAKEQVSNTHVYVLINLRNIKDVEHVEYYIVPSKIIAKKALYQKAKSGSEWYYVNLIDLEKFKDNWEVFL